MVKKKKTSCQETLVLVEYRSLSSLLTFGRILGWTRIISQNWRGNCSLVFWLLIQLGSQAPPTTLAETFSGQINGDLLSATRQEPAGSPLGISYPETISSAARCLSSGVKGWDQPPSSPTTPLSPSPTSAPFGIGTWQVCSCSYKDELPVQDSHSRFDCGSSQTGDNTPSKAAGYGLAHVLTTVQRVHVLHMRTST